MANDPMGAIAASALDRLTDFVAAFDDSGAIVYANPFAVRLLGYDDVEGILGTSIVDHLHPDDLERALSVVARIEEGALGVPVTPAFYRLRRADGSWLRIEINATEVHGETGTTLVVFGRYSGDHDLEDRVMSLLTGQASTSDAVALVPQFGNWRHEGIDYAVFFLDDDGDPACAGSSRLCALGGLDDPGSPWATVAKHGADLAAAIDPSTPFGQRAAAERFTDVVAIAVPDPLHEGHGVVAFARREGGAAAEVHTYALEIMAKVLALILQWRHQVVSLRRAARRDPLTGLANRTRVWELLEDLGKRRRSSAVAVLYVDLDGFKGVNDEHGHGTGDAVLAAVAARLGRVVRPDDLVARLGGDEFAVIATELGEDASAVATAIADRIVDALAEPFEVEGRRLGLGASVGIAVERTDAVDPDRIIDRADAALYRAKAGGRGRWLMADGDA